MVNWEQYQGGAANWDALVESLSGGFYQAHGWAEVRRTAGWEPLRLLARESGNVIAAASVLVKRKAGAAICWIPGGPIGLASALDGQFKAALGRFLGTRMIYCRLSLLRPSLAGEEECLASNGWKRPTANMSSGLTMLYTLEGDDAERLTRTTGNWRHNLKRSGRHDLRVEHWATPDLAALSALYREMEALKSIPVQHTEAELDGMLRHLGKRIVMYRCLDAEGNLLAVRAAGLMGDIAMDLLAVAGGAARKVYASHATLWALLCHCNRLGLRYYDLSGVDPAGNKGVFDFKHGTGAAMIECLGEWEWASLPGMRQAVNWLLARNSHG